MKNSTFNVSHQEAVRYESLVSGSPAEDLSHALITPSWEWLPGAIKMCSVLDKMNALDAMLCSPKCFGIPFSESVDAFIGINFEEHKEGISSGDLGLYPSLAVLALRYLIAHRKNDYYISKGVLPVDTSATLPPSEMLECRLREMLAYDNKQEYLNDCYFGVVAVEMVPRPVWSSGIPSLSSKIDFRSLMLLVYQQDKSFWSELLPDHPDSENILPEDVLYRRSYYMTHDNSDQEPYHSIKLINRVSQRKVLNDRLRIFGSLYRNDPSWKVKRDNNLLYFHNSEKGRVLFHTNVDLERQLSIVVANDASELCFSSDGDFITVVNLKEALKQIDLAEVLASGIVARRYTCEWSSIHVERALRSLNRSFPFSF